MAAILALGAACRNASPPASPSPAPAPEPALQIRVHTSAGSEAMREVLTEDAHHALRGLSEAFGRPVDFALELYWIDGATWRDPQTAGGHPARLPYGMPFSVPGKALVVLPAAERDVPPFIKDIYAAVDTAPADPKTLADHYRAILVHELCHLFWFRAGMPDRPKWLSEGVPQLAVIAATRWPRFAEIAPPWIDLNRRLYRQAAGRMPITELGEISRIYMQATPLNYSWFLGGLFILYEELDAKVGGELLERVAATMPTKPGQRHRITDAQAAQLIDAAAKRPHDPTLWTRRGLLAPSSAIAK